MGFFSIVGIPLFQALTDLFKDAQVSKFHGCLCRNAHFTDPAGNNFDYSTDLTQLAIISFCSLC